MSQDEFDTYYQDYPVCPGCGQEDQDWADGLEPGISNHDGASWDRFCHTCMKEYRVTINYEPSFTTCYEESTE